MKTKLFFYLVFVLISSMNQVFAQEWSYFKDYPKSISFFKADYDNFGRNYALSSEYQIWMKTSSSNWIKFGEYPVSNFRDLMVDKSTGVVYLADEASGLIYTNNNGQTWQQAWLQNNPTSGLKESLNALSNINATNSFYSAGLTAIFPLSPRLFKYQISGNTISSIQEVTFDITNNSGNYPLAVHQSESGTTVIVGTSSNGFWTSTNGGLNFTNYLPNLKVYSICHGANDTYFALVIDQSNGQNVLMKSNDGQSWSSFAIPPIINEKFTELYFDNSLNELWVGSTNNIYKIQNLEAGVANLISQDFNNSAVYVSGITKTDSKVNLFTLQYTFQTLTNTGWVQNLNGFTGVSQQLIFNESNDLFSVDFTTPILSKTNSASTQWLNMLLDNSPIGGLDALQKDGLGNVFSKKINKIFKVSSSGSVTTIDSPVSSGYISRYYVADNGSLYLVHNSNPQNLYFFDNDGASWSIIQQLPNNDSFTSIEVDMNQTIYYTSGANLTSFFYKTVNSNSWIQVDYDTSGEFNGCFTEAIINRSKDKVFLRVCGKTFLIENFNISSQIQPPLGDDPGNIGVLIQLDSGLYTNAIEGTLIKVFKSLDNGNTWTALGCPNELINYPNAVYTMLSDELNNIYIQTSPFVNLPSNISGIYKLTEILSTPDFDNESNLIIYPNPTKEVLNVKSALSLDRYTIFDLSGRIIYSAIASSNAIDVSALSSGTYFLKVDDDSGNTKTVKFMKD